MVRGPNDEAAPDWPLVIVSASVVAAVCTPLFAWPEAASQWVAWLYSQITNYVGTVYLGAGALTLAFCVWIAISRHGKTKLGDVTPQFSTVSWVAMLFCAGVATGILYWGTIEWAFYYEAPPFGARAGSPSAAQWARVFGVFHWGPTGWALYCLPALAIGHAYYRAGIPSLRLSAACHAVMPHDSKLARAVDLCFMLGVVGSSGTSLGFGTPMIAAGFSRLTGVQESYELTVAIAVVCAGIFSTSVYLGVEKGIRSLSLINTGLAMGFLVFVFLAGPTSELLKTATGDLWFVAKNFIRMHALLGPLNSAHYQFARDWTIFYWAWWIAVGPFMGVFIAQISRGRELREIVIGTLTLGSAGSAVFYFALGNYGQQLQQSGTLDVVGITRSDGAPQAIIRVISSLPFEQIVLPVFCLISLVFLATTYDSTAYALASTASVDLKENQAPSRRHRLFWAFALAVLPTALLAGDAGGGRLRSLQTASLIASLPLLVVMVLMAVSLTRSLRRD